MQMMSDLDPAELALPGVTRRRLERGGAGLGSATASLTKGFWYYRRGAIRAFALVLSFGVLVALVMPARYRSEAKLLALTSDSYDVRSDSSDSKSEPFKPEDVVNLEMQLLASHDLHREALRRMPVAPTDAAAIERARDAFTRSLSVTKAADANVIELAFTDRDPARANAALSRLIDVYQQSRARLLLSGEAAQLARQRGVAQADLAAAADALRVFQAEHGIADIDAQITGAVTLDTSLRERLADAEAGLSGARGSLARLRATAREVPRTIEIYRDDSEAAKGVADMQNQILQLQAKRADLAGRYMAGSPLIVQADKQIVALRQAVVQQSGRLQAARRTGRNTAYDAAIGQLRDTDAAASSEAAKRARLSRDIAASNARLRELNGLAARIGDLKLRRDVAQDRFRLLDRQVDQARARTSDALAGGSNVRVIQAPDVPTARSNPAWLIIAGALFAALVVAGALLLLRALGRKVLLDDVEAATSAQAPIVADLREPFAPAAHGAVAHALAMTDRPLTDRLPADRGRIIAIVASSAEDLDASVPQLIDQLRDAERGVGIVTIGSDGDRGVARMATAGLPPEQILALGDQAWFIEEADAAQIAAMRERFGWLLLVPPPIPASEPTGVAARSRAQIAASADQVLLVARTEHTHRAALEAVAALFERSGRPVAGLLLTGCRLAWPRFLPV